ncbi:WbqC family protein [Parabacteroides sp. Marseille-P3160]|uniref:WbqC family protein n=1 Tax=Parabacteroides sp. Marseille-P3160 TaxID=1917887 RepID=UPI0009B99F3D|nr:WbqC family protein [Parabacteroides sp. Marseille-P3160]
MEAVYLSTAYLAPVQYYCKLFQYEQVYIETEENYLKQTYRNRCHIAGANGVLPLSIPIEKPETIKCLTKDIRISDHGNWRHLHWNAIVSAYNTSPFFEYYQDDFVPFYSKKQNFLLDFNEELRQLVCELLDLHPAVAYTEQYQPTVAHDFRESIRPKHAGEDPDFVPLPYYQVFATKYGFLPNLSILDLLFNMGPEGLLVLKNYTRHKSCER